VHLGTYLISVIQNNPNKNLIISMSINWNLGKKRRKGKRDPQICVNPNEGSLKEFKGVSMKFPFIFLKYRNTVLLRGACGSSENNQAKSFSTLPK
jgi:hypothetical protein